LKLDQPPGKTCRFGGAAAHARAYRPMMPCRSSPTIPDESSMYIRALVIRSIALRSTGTACPARSDAISRSHASARFRTVCEYSRRLR